ncbi:MAG TPA: organomercurial lyase MerB [Ktedonobacteraceae bacterium]|nr:organomercurial lyase MerB [Ktedonobacteraceae bacterium]
MQQAEMDEIARSLALGLSHNSTVLRQDLLQLLIEGQPVSVEQLSAATDRPVEEIKAELADLPNLEYNEQGNIVGSGITQVQTPHHFNVNGHELYTWCALDTLFYPILLQQTAQVESTCPVTGKHIRLTVSPKRVEFYEPSGAVMSLVVPEALEAWSNIRGSFCNHIYFFENRFVAQDYLATNTGTMILTIEEAFELGRQTMEYRKFRV